MKEKIEALIRELQEEIEIIEESMYNDDSIQSHLVLVTMHDINTDIINKLKQIIK